MASAARSLTVVERVTGGGATDFGVPTEVAATDLEPSSVAAARRQAAIVAAAWAHLDQVAAGAPLTLLKGPRGGGRDRDPIVAHVFEAEDAYARKLGIREPDARSRRAALLDLLGRASDGSPRSENYLMNSFSSFAQSMANASGISIARARRIAIIKTGSRLTMKSSCC